MFVFTQYGVVLFQGDCEIYCQCQISATLYKTNPKSTQILDFNLFETRLWHIYILFFRMGSNMRYVASFFEFCFRSIRIY